MGGVYNLRTMPGEVVVADGRVISCIRRESDTGLIDRIVSRERML